MSFQGFALEADAGQAYWFLGNLMTVKAGGAETNGRFTFIEAVAPPGFAPPPHTHRDEDEAFYLLEGDIDVTCGDKKWTVGPGGFVFLPRGVPHGFTVRESGVAKMLQLTLPAQFERFAAEVGEPAAARTLPPPSVPDIPALLQIMAKYGIVAAPPPA